MEEDKVPRNKNNPPQGLKSDLPITLNISNPPSKIITNLPENLGEYQLSENIYSKTWSDLKGSGPTETDLDVKGNERVPNQYQDSKRNLLRTPLTHFRSLPSMGFTKREENLDLTDRRLSFEHRDRKFFNEIKLSLDSKEEAKKDYGLLPSAHYNNNQSVHYDSNEENKQDIYQEPVLEIQNSAQNIAGASRSLSNNLEQDENTNLNTQDRMFQNGSRFGGARRAQINLYECYEPEIKVYLTQIIILMVAITLFSAVVLSIVTSDFSIKGLFLVAWGYLFFHIFVYGFWKRRVLGNLWKQSEDLFLSMDGSSTILALLLSYLKLLFDFGFSTFGCMPFVLTGGIYFFFLEGPLKRRLIKSFPRLLYVLQSLLVGLRIDGFVTTRLEFLFIPAWLFLSMKSIYCFKYARILLRVICSFLFQRRRDQNQRFAMKMCGSFWYFLNYCWPIMAIIALEGAAIAYNQNSTQNFDLLDGVAYVSMGMSTAVVLYTLFWKKYIFQFIVAFRVIESYRARAAESVTEIQTTIINFEAEKKSSYFVMLSPTYFVPLNKSFFSQSEENIQRIKSIASTRHERFKSKCNSRLRTGCNKIFEDIDIEALKQNKEDLDKKLQKMQETNSKNEGFNNNKTLCIVKTQTATETEELRKGNTTMQEFEMKQKVAMSLDNIEEIKQMTNEEMTSKAKEEALCYICYVSQPDAILVNCGHGGICYNCAITSLRNKNECMECRKKVNGIYKVHPSPKFSNIIQGIELNKLIETTS